MRSDSRHFPIIDQSLSAPIVSNRVNCRTTALDGKSEPLGPPIHFWTQSGDQVSCYGKPVERTNEIIQNSDSLTQSDQLPREINEA